MLACNGSTTSTPLYGGSCIDEDCAVDFDALVGDVRGSSADAPSNDSEIKLTLEGGVDAADANDDAADADAALASDVVSDGSRTADAPPSDGDSD
jgi:hypothetical protein